jgi:hypothetical protein
VKIQVDNIREYEQRQLQLAQEMAEKRLKFTTLKSRLQNQCVILLLSLLLSCAGIDFFF